MKKRILCYGDSNTWGYVPGVGSRFDENTRWTGRLQQLLGTDYEILENGINGRNTCFDDPYEEHLNGKRGLLYSLAAQKPVDLVILSLGTNDLKYTTAAGSAKGVETLLRMVLHADDFILGSTPVFRKQPKILVISPIAMHPDVSQLSPASLLSCRYSESLRFAEYLRPICEAYGVEYLDAAQYAQAPAIDGIHMDAENHRKLAEAVSKKVREIFS